MTWWPGRLKRPSFSVSKDQLSEALALAAPHGLGRIRPRQPIHPVTGEPARRAGVRQAENRGDPRHRQAGASPRPQDQLRHGLGKTPSHPGSGAWAMDKRRAPTRSLPRPQPAHGAHRHAKCLGHLGRDLTGPDLGDTLLSTVSPQVGIKPSGGRSDEGWSSFGTSGCCLPITA